MFQYVFEDLNLGKTIKFQIRNKSITLVNVLKEYSGISMLIDEHNGRTK